MKNIPKRKCGCRKLGYSDVDIEKQEGNYLAFTAEGKQREYSLPGCVSNGFVILDDESITERCRKEVGLLEKLQKLNKEQRIANLELEKC